METLRFYMQNRGNALIGRHIRQIRFRGKYGTSVTAAYADAILPVSPYRMATWLVATITTIDTHQPIRRPKYSSVSATKKY